MKDIVRLAELMQQRNAIDEQIAQIINRPALIGHMGEYIASRILDIKLAGSATNIGHDGYFSSGLLENCTVNVKFYGKRENILDFPQRI